jgi:hypothetical protein
MTRRTFALSAAVALVASATFGLTFSAPVQATGATDSAMTKRGSGEFADLQVTVDQTKNLVDQIVRISWRGGKKTVPGSGQYSYNYLQIMQCWGDDPAGPRREQCQFGGLTGDDRGGAQASTRQVNYGDQTVDPLETIKPDEGSVKNVYVPFEPANGDDPEPGTTSKYFNEFTTNEVPFAATRGDGTGNDYFAIQTVREAAGLGCGSPVTQDGKTKGRPCWLVVVPRGGVEVDGDEATLSKKLVSSPLGASNWKNRIVFPLEFEPAGRPCPLGTAERKTLGQESVAEAVLRWQPVLCDVTGRVFSYSQVADDVARRGLVDDPSLSFVSQPVDPKSLADGAEIAYAPIAISGITVGFNVDRQTPIRAPAEVKARDGERVTTMKLTPRLVAKLLTQSYTRAANINAPSVQGNPTDMTKDPEFQILNPQYEGLTISLPELQLPAGRADVVQQVWKWILADPDAKAFVDGDADPWGMKINTNYTDVELPRSDYPKADDYCVKTDGRPDLCTLDAHPYAANMQEAARNAARGDFRGLTYWDPIAVPVPAYKRDRPQPSGSRAMLALTDSASAARYGLETASLLNGGGEFVTPTTAALTAATKELATGPASAPLQPTVANRDPKSYPLTNITYAATDPERLDAAERKDYSGFLNYAAGAGQKPGLLPGNLPTGYAPLSKAFSERTLTIAKAVATGTPAPPPPSSNGSPTNSGGSSGTPDSIGVPEGSLPATPPGETLPSTADPLAGGADPRGAVDAQTVALTTPLDAAGVGRLVPLVALVLGLLTAAAGPILLKLSASGRF